MAAKAIVLTAYFLISLLGIGRTSCSATEEKNENSIMSFFKSLEIKLENKLSECVTYLTEFLESFNDEHLGRSKLGRFLRYEEIKPRIAEEERHSKKGSTMMPQLMFHVGAVSTWMLLTTILTAKSLAVGLLLLVFKIAVSSAKVAAYFTSQKSTGWEHHETSWTPHYDHSYST